MQWLPKGHEVVVENQLKNSSVQGNKFDALLKKGKQFYCNILQRVK